MRGVRLGGQIRISTQLPLEQNDKIVAILEF